MWDYVFDQAQPQAPGEPTLNYIEFSRSQFGQARPYHAHTDCHLMFCMKGRAFLRINGAELDLTPGKAAVIHSGALHSCGPREEGLDFWGIAFSPSGPEDELSRFFSSRETLTADFSGYLDYARGAFLFIYETAARLRETAAPSRSQKQEAEAIIRTQTLALLHFARSMFTLHPCRHEPLRELPMGGIMRWMMEHYAENLSLDSLAEQFALSPSHLSRKFQEAFHVSPINYLIDYRINEAKDLLIYTDKTITQIAAEVGYANPYHFSSLFSRRTGMTPQQMRAHCRNVATQPESVVFRGEDGE